MMITCFGSILPRRPLFRCEQPVAESAQLRGALRTRLGKTLNLQSLAPRAPVGKRCFRTIATGCEGPSGVRLLYGHYIHGEPRAHGCQPFEKQ
jgi:hypothetical protein